MNTTICESCYQPGKRYEMVERGTTHGGHPQAWHKACFTGTLPTVPVSPPPARVEVPAQRRGVLARLREMVAA